ncbi:hypothetical protein MY4824_009967 [Beauveria thailandica]
MVHRVRLFGANPIFNAPNTPLQAILGPEWIFMGDVS